MDEIQYFCHVIFEKTIYLIYFDNRFQDPGHQFEDLNEEYLQNLKVLLGNDEEKIAALLQVIKSKYICGDIAEFDGNWV